MLACLTYYDYELDFLFFWTYQYLKIYKLINANIFRKEKSGFIYHLPKFIGL
jgi:hypothetical protein